jgi:hypothetical protein
LCLLVPGAHAADDGSILADVKSVYDAADYQTSLPGITSDLPQPETEDVPDEAPDDTDGAGWFGKTLVTLLKWLSIIAFAGAVLFVIFSAYRAWRNLRLTPRRTDRNGTAVSDGRGPDHPIPAISRLADAEGLARDGAFAEAIHALLLAVVDAMRQRADQAVMPALTARELVHLVTLDDAGRSDFAGLVARSERGHFGGRPADRSAFDDCLQCARRLVDALAQT